MRPKRSTAACAAASGAGDVQLGDQQVVLRPAQGFLDLYGPAAGGDDLVAGGEGLAGDVRAQTGPRMP
jgi:hypothetical protein